MEASSVKSDSLAWDGPPRWDKACWIMSDGIKKHWPNVHGDFEWWSQPKQFDFQAEQSSIMSARSQCRVKNEPILDPCSRIWRRLAKRGTLRTHDVKQNQHPMSENLQNCNTKSKLQLMCSTSPGKTLAMSPETLVVVDMLKQSGNCSWAQDRLTKELVWQTNSRAETPHCNQLPSRNMQQKLH